MGISDPMFSGDLQRRVAELERQLRNLTSGRRLEDASIGARGITVKGGGSITIDGGELRLIDENGVQVAFFGDVTQDGIVSRGWALSFDTGVKAFTLAGDPGAQFWSLRDGTGAPIVTNDAITGVGLGKPYLNYRMVPSFGAESSGVATAMWPSTTSTTPVKLMQGINPVWHPRVSIGVSTTTAGGGNVDWRLDVNGDLAASGTGVGSQTVVIPGWDDTITPGEAVGFDLYANCSGGATRAWIQCDRLYGLQS